MITIPRDDLFSAFVAGLRRDGHSDQSIAAALNKSDWAAPGGRRWHGRQVAGLCTGTPALGGALGFVSATVEDEPATDHRTDDVPHETCNDPACRYHLRLALLRELRSYHPFDPRAHHVIETYAAAGESAATIAARLNQDGIAPPTGSRWSARLVRTMTSVGVADDATVESAVRAAA